MDEVLFFLVGFVKIIKKYRVHQPHPLKHSPERSHRLKKKKKNCPHTEEEVDSKFTVVLSCSLMQLAYVK